MFKRRKPDDPINVEPGATLPAGLPESGQESASAGPVDTGLGVPPFRPAQPQQQQPMSR